MADHARSDVVAVTGEATQAAASGAAAASSGSDAGALPGGASPSGASTGGASTGGASTGAASTGAASTGAASTGAASAHGGQHGRLVSWAAVVTITVGFLVGSAGMVFGPTWWLFWVGAGLVALGGIVALGTGIFDDWY